MTQSAYIRLGGGIDLVTPPEQLPPGAAIYAVNYECPVTGGYRRIDGYVQLGPEVPGEGPVLGVATFADRRYAVRKDAGADAATLYRLNEAGETWEAVHAVHNGRHEFVEGNVYATESGRALYGVGGGLPFELVAENASAVEYGSLLELAASLRGSLPEGVSYSVGSEESAGVLTITDSEGRAITGIEVRDKSGGNLVSVPDEAAGDPSATTVAIDTSSIEDINTIGDVVLTVDGESPSRLAIPEVADPFQVLDGAQPGASYIALFSNHLFLGYPSGSVQHSGLGSPGSWNVASGGAGEIGVGQELVGLIPGTGGVLHILCRDSVKTLYGTSIADWQLKTTVPNSGARPYSCQSLMQPYFVAERGITSLDATQQYGDFRPMQPGAKVEPLFTEEGFTNRVVASAISKAKAQYRLFFDDGSGVYMSPAGITTVRFPVAVAVAHSGELSSGAEQVLIGDDQGRVYRLDNGAPSFDGEPIEAFLTLAYTDLNSPSARKRFRRAFWDIRSGTDARISVLPDFDYGRIETARSRRFFIDFMLGGGLWDVDEWGTFSWSVPSLAQEPVDIAGTGTSINFAIYSGSVSAPHELLGYDIVYDVRRQRRG